MVQLGNQLKQAEKILSNVKVDIQDNSLNMPISEYVFRMVEKNEFSSIFIQFKNDVGYVNTVFGNRNSPIIVKFDNIDDSIYISECEKLGVDTSERYNSSSTLIYNGIQVRVFAMMPPTSEYPTLVLSSTKTPPEIYNLSIDESIFKRVFENNFIVCGKSGSGKTYLTNYLINKFTRPDEIALVIEEFNELIIPNDASMSLVVPPRKPNEPSLLEYVVEQSNLMRADRLVVGEIKGREAWPFIINLSSGTKGCSTFHATDEKQALKRMRSLCALSAPQETVDELMSKAIQYVIMVENWNITSISQLTGVHTNGVFGMQNIWHL